MKQFNMKTFENNLKLAVYKILEMKAENDKLRCRMETKKNDENIKIYVIESSKIIRIVDVGDKGIITQNKSIDQSEDSQHE